MTNREAFITEIETLITAKGGDPLEILSEQAYAYFEELKAGKASVGGMTENGAKVLTWLQNNETPAAQYFSAKIIGEGLFVSSRVVSGAARKLITDGYLTKEGKNPVTYALTEQGRSYQP